VPAPTLAPSRVKGDLLRREEKGIRVDKDGFFLRENEAKVVISNW